jgi:hypothetical protein
VWLSNSRLDGAPQLLWSSQQPLPKATDNEGHEDMDLIKIYTNGTDSTAATAATELDLSNAGDNVVLDATAIVATTFARPHTPAERIGYPNADDADIVALHATAARWRWRWLGFEKTNKNNVNKSLCHWTNANEYLANSRFGALCLEFCTNRLSF